LESIDRNKKTMKTLGKEITKRNHSRDVPLASPSL